MDGYSLVGKQVQSILEQLKNERSLIRMKLMENDFQLLTIIHDFRSRGNSLYFLVDSQDDFFNQIKKNTSAMIHFEFTNADKLSFFFNAKVAGVDKKGFIWIAFPEIIERKQVRRDFRVDAPQGTYMSFLKDSIKFNKGVINLSLGGAFGVVIIDHDNSVSISTGDSLMHIEMFFKLKNIDHQLNIRKAAVVRLEEKSLRNVYCSAIHFVDIDKTEEKSLTELIYIFQREYLQKRLK